LIYFSLNTILPNHYFKSSIIFIEYYLEKGIIMNINQLNQNSPEEIKGTIVVISHDSTDGEFISTVAGDFGYQVDELNTIFDISSIQKADIIIVDEQVIQSDSFKKIRSNDVLRKIPMLCICSFDSHETRRLVFDKGISDYILKPFFAEELIARIELQRHYISLKHRLDVSQEKCESENIKHQETEEILKDKTIQLDQRVKVLNCLYAISTLASKPNTTLTDIVAGILNVIPNSWQYPDITCARIILEGLPFETDNFDETKWSINQDIIVDGNTIGSIEVGYLTQKFNIDEGPFLLEERKLLDEIAERLGKIIEQELAKEEIATILKTMRDGFWIVGTDGRIIDVNDAYCQMIQYTRDELLHMTVSDIETIPTENKTEEHIEMSIEKGGELFETRHRCKDGSFIDVEISVNYLETSGGRFFAFIRDISERKHSEIAMHRARETAEQATRAKNEFIAKLSHEVRTPLNGLIGSIQLISTETALSTEQMEYIDKMETSANILMSVINDLLDISKIESGELTLEEQDFRIQTLVYDIIGIIKPKTLYKNIILKHVFESDIPYFLKGDPGRIGQILFNFLENAVKYTDHGTIELRIALIHETDDFATIQFKVNDTGQGITKEQLTYLNNYFSNKSTNIQKQYKYGLGLAICKQLIELMQGEIYVTSELKKGSTFWFNLKIKKKKDCQSVFVSSNNLSEKPFQSQNINVLVVEDDIVSRKLAERMLHRLGISVYSVENGEDAITHLSQNNVDIVFMDVNMPIMNGYDASRIIRSKDSSVLNHDIPIIAMTANVMVGDRERCLDAGMTDYLPKPIRLSDIRLCVENVIKPKQH